ncbi:hypothetical protein ACFLU6_09835 [Acidobacteriota bacterium]
MRYAKYRLLVQAMVSVLIVHIWIAPANLKADMTEMMQMDLQQAQQRYAQAMQLIANLIKSFQDTARIIIQNAR